MSIVRIECSDYSNRDGSDGHGTISVVAKMLSLESEYSDQVW